MMEKALGARVAIAYIEDEESKKVLFGRRNDCDKYTTPGGHIEDGEEPIIGLIREVKEETGLTVSSAELISVTYNPEKNIFIYLYKVKSDNTFNNSIKSGRDFNDPDNEVDEWSYVWPTDIQDELHVPLKDNVVTSHWANLKIKP